MRKTWRRAESRRSIRGILESKKAAGFCTLPITIENWEFADVKKARVLLTNDDGYQAAGLKALAG